MLSIGTLNLLCQIEITRLVGWKWSLIFCYFKVKGKHISLSSEKWWDYMQRLCNQSVKIEEKVIHKLVIW